MKKKVQNNHDNIRHMKKKIQNNHDNLVSVVYIVR